MKNLVIVFCLLLFFGLEASSQNSEAPQPDISGGVPAVSNIRGAQFPLILPNHRVVFRIKAPDAQRCR